MRDLYVKQITYNITGTKLFLNFRYRQIVFHVDTAFPNRRRCSTSENLQIIVRSKEFDQIFYIFWVEIRKMLRQVFISKIDRLQQ